MDATRTFAVILEPEAEALAMAKEAIALAIEERLAEGEEIPTEQAPQLQ